MSEKTQLNTSSPQFAYLEYLLQLSLGASTGRIVSAYALSNPHLTVQFERRCKDILTLDAWLDPTQLTGVNTEDEIIRRGFKFETPSSGARFTVGNIVTAPEENSKLRKIMFCKIGVGRAYVSDTGSSEKNGVPEGYDSFYLTDKSASVNGCNHNNNNGAAGKRDGGHRHQHGHDGCQGEVYHHEYFIKNAAQILPLYVIHYEYDSTKERKSREKPKCDNCEASFASVYCSADNANLCPDCDRTIHATKLASRHVRTPIGKGADVFGNCRSHPEKMVEFFCSTCHVPVCVYCKMVGHHSSGEASKHKLMSVADAYQTVLHEAQMSDSLLTNRRTAITNQLTAINNRAKSVEKMTTQIESQIEEIYRRALHDLRSIIKKKLDILLGDELELKRQMGEINRLEEFLQYQQSGDATHFLSSWARHQQIRSELHDFKHFRDAIDVQLDVKVAGNINVLVESVSPPVSRNVTTNNNGNGVANNVPGIHVSSASSVTNSMPMPMSTSPGKKYGGLVKANYTPGFNKPPSPTKFTGRGQQRRTSDFFSETLGALDEVGSVVHGGSVLHDDDLYSVISGHYPMEM